MQGSLNQVHPNYFRHERCVLGPGLVWTTAEIRLPAGKLESEQLVQRTRGQGSSEGPQAHWGGRSRGTHRSDRCCRQLRVKFLLEGWIDRDVCWFPELSRASHR